MQDGARVNNYLSLICTLKFIPKRLGGDNAIKVKLT